MLLHALFVFYIFILLSTSSIGKENDGRIEKRHNFSVRERGFYLNGEKFNFRAGEIHYFRIAACEWEDRLRKLQRAGLNTVSTAVEWAMHEPTPKTYNWDGNANFTRFIQLAQNLNLFVIVRAGPYIGVDRRLGGIPGWLLTTNELKDNPWVQRSSPEYRLYAERWLSHFLPKLFEMMVTNGGPVLMIQIDSDLGESTPCSTIAWLREIYLKYLGEETVLFTMNENNNNSLKCGEIENTTSAFRINPWDYFITFERSLIKLFSAVKQVAPKSPRLIEIRTGLAWDWEGPRFSFGTEKIITTINDLMGSDTSIIIYMFAGGTNFERAGKSNSKTMGLTTSYDFDAIISESGDETEKFGKLQSRIPEKKLTIDDTEETIGIDVYGELNFTSLGSLLDPDFRADFGLVGIESQYPLTFRKLNVVNGLVLYKTDIPENFKSRRTLATLYCKNILDRGYVYVNDSLYGILDNRGYNSIKIPVYLGGNIQILVENTGFLAQTIIGEPKGIMSDVTLNNKILKNWTMYVVPLEDVKYLQEVVRNIPPRKPVKEGNTFLLAKFQIPDKIRNSTFHTYLNMSQSAKGQVFLNEYSLGNYWMNGPQYELRVPECYFNPHPMENQMLILQLQKNKMYFDEQITLKRAKNLNKSGDSRNDQEKIISYILLFYLCWFWKPGYSFMCY